VAKYSDIQDLYNKRALLPSIMTAVAIAAQQIVAEAPATPNHAQRLLWAARALRNPEQMARDMELGIYAANAGFTILQITSATDAAIQTAVNNLIDTFAVAVT